MAVFLESERFPAGRLLVNDKGRYLDRLGGPERFKRQHSDSSIPQGALPGNCLGEQQAWRRFGLSEEVMIAIGTLCLVLSAVCRNTGVDLLLSVWLDFPRLARFRSSSV